VGYVKKAFKIANEVEIVLSTASLDVCRGQHVEIDEQAYPHMWDVLDEIIVGRSGNGTFSRNGSKSSMSFESLSCSRCSWGVDPSYNTAICHPIQGQETGLDGSQ
jgi:hypothetical protein